MPLQIFDLTERIEDTCVPSFVSFVRPSRLPNFAADSTLQKTSITLRLKAMTSTKEHIPGHVRRRVSGVLVVRVLPLRTTPDAEHIQAREIRPVQHLTMRRGLNFLRWGRRPRVSPGGDKLLALQMLHASGPVEEEIKSSIATGPHFWVSFSHLRFCFHAGVKSGS
jgi:hypothetical protein